MEFPIIDNTAEYVEFMKKNFPQKKIGKMPKSEKDLDLTVRIEMENSAPHLLQRIINPKPAETLPADVLDRYNKNMLWVEDIPVYRQAGMTGLAAKAPIFPNPRTAVPFEITATKFDLDV